MPLIREKLHTLDTQIHCMKMNGQTPVDVCNQPVYALTKQVQWKFPNLFKDYFTLFRGLHVEKCVLGIHGQYTKGSGLSKLLGKSNLSISGLENTLVNANNIKCARYAVQVAACALYEKVKRSICKFTIRIESSRTSNSGHFYRQGQVAVIGRWPLLGGGRYWEVAAIQRFTTIWESVWD